jgi:osmotically-inducible protein OsmY
MQVARLRSCRAATLGSWLRFRPLGAGAVALALLAGSSALAAPSDLRDLHNEVLVRSAFTDDPYIKPLNLVVMVRNQVATISGFVPTRELARRALTIAGRVPEILDVRDRMTVQNQGGLLALPEKANPIARPQQEIAAADSANAIKPLPWPTMWRPIAQEAAPAPVAIGSTFLPNFYGTKAAGNTASWIKAPLKPSAEVPATDALVGALVLADNRYRGVRYEVKDGKVYLGGIVASWSDLAKLMADLRQVAGVQEVLLREVRCVPAKPILISPWHIEAGKAAPQNRPAP